MPLVLENKNVSELQFNKVKVDPESGNDFFHFKEKTFFFEADGGRAGVQKAKDFFQRLCRKVGTNLK